MRLPKIPLAQTIIQLCKAKGVKHIVISPGSRNAPLTIGFTNHDHFECYSIVDERCAAFFALGIAQQLKEPVAVVCTSGSALLNYYPAVAEAFYSDLPLVVISADRPAHLINIGDGQTINQKHVFANHILYEANLEEGEQAFNERHINTALDTAISNKGPVHINAPFNEPLYELIDNFTVNVQATNVHKEASGIADLSEFKELWNSSQRKMVLVGVNAPGEIDRKYLEILAEDDSVLVFTETTSNVHHKAFFPSIDKIIAPLTDKEFEELQPDILLTFGGMIVSKKIKAFLRKYQPKHHWHVDRKKAFDTFFCLSQHFKSDVNAFLNMFCADYVSVNSNYGPHWQDVKAYRAKMHDAYLTSISYCDLKVFDRVLGSVPDNVNLQLGNSSTVRYVQLFDIKNSFKVYCNRGTSGIDGSTSTAVGMAVASSEQTVFITGDLSFFYDSNALWNAHIPHSFRIILINNGGGGIFRILPGHKNTDNFDTYFETKHQYDANHLCDMYGFEYTSAEDLQSVETTLKTFYTEGTRPKLLEIFTPSTLNDEVLLNYFQSIK